MEEVDKLSAKSEDLLLTVARHGQFWRVHVEEIGYPNTALSGGQDFSTLERAKEGAISIARELFGTAVLALDLDWHATK